MKKSNVYYVTSLSSMMATLMRVQDVVNDKLTNLQDDVIMARAYDACPLFFSITDKGDLAMSTYDGSTFVLPKAIAREVVES
jgi:hypothetical protein